MAADTRSFRHDIQGLRALAVGLVVIYHVWPASLPGGYVGVDVFFVISGFLITGHLLARDDPGVAGLARFWARRLARLLPAALVVLAASVVATVVWLPDVRWAATVDEALAATFYVENRQLASAAVNYLRVGDAPTVVQHYWSLSVEEQFYLGWPLLLVGATFVARRSGRSRAATTAVVVGAVSAASLALSVWLTSSDPARAYFATSARIWELGVGALLAAVAAMWPSVERGRRPQAGRNVAASAIAWCGLAAIVVAALTYSAGTAFPGWHALLPVVGTSAVIAAAPRGGRLDPDRLLRTPPFQLVGDLSYSLYLWHWPVVVIAPAIAGWSLNGAGRIAAVVMSVGLAFLTTRLVEHRFRVVGTHAPFPQIYRRAAAGMVAVAVLVGGVHVVTSRRQQDARKALAAAVTAEGPCFGAAAAAGECAEPGTALVVPDPIIAGEDRTRLYDDECWEYPPFAETTSCTYGDPAAPLSIALVGNSHAGHWFTAVEAIALANDARVTTFLAAGCTVTTARLTWETDEHADGCQAWGQRAVDATSTGEFDLVVTSEIATRLVEGGSPDGVQRNADWRAGYVGILEQWVAADQQVLVLRDTPRVPSAMASPPECVAIHGDDLEPCRGPRGSWLLLDPLAEAAGLVDPALVTVTDLTHLFCDATCAAVIGDVLVFYDRNHMTDTFAASLVPYLEPPLVEALAAGAQRGG